MALSVVTFCASLYWTEWENLPDSVQQKEETQKSIFICLKTDDESSYTHTKALELVEYPESTILKYPVNQLFEKYWDDNKSHPLCVHWGARNYGDLFGIWWIESSKLPQKVNFNRWKITSKTLYQVWDTLLFYLIDPSLVDKFPENLSDQMKESWFETFVDKNYVNSKENENSFDIVVKPLIWWKSALALYKNWKLFMATYVSVWKFSSQTKMWQYTVLWTDPYKRSFTYNNAAMPFSIRYYWWYYLHWWITTWFPMSHWCIRLPWLAADVLFSFIRESKTKTGVYISKELYKTVKM